jgi:hypothetical protein
MSTPTSHRSDTRTSFWNRVKSLLIGAVPEDVAICEFDCRKNQCTYGEWATCDRRIALTSLCREGAVDVAEDSAGKIAAESGSDPVQA